MWKPIKTFQRIGELNKLAMRVGHRRSGYIVIAATLLLQTSSANSTSCDEISKATISKLTDEISALNKQKIAYHGPSSPTEPGVCTKLLAKISGTFHASYRANPLLTDHYNKISCKEIEKLVIIRKCKCATFGIDISGDYKVIGRTLQSTERLNKASNAARRLGIKDKVIRSYVNQASRISDCWHIKAATMLDKVASDLETALRRND